MNKIKIRMAFLVFPWCLRGTDNLSHCPNTLLHSTLQVLTFTYYLPTKTLPKILPWDVTLFTHTLIRTWTVPAAGGDLGMEGTATVDTVMGACPGVWTLISSSRCICNNKCMGEDSVSYMIYNIQLDAMKYNLCVRVCVCVAHTNIR